MINFDTRTWTDKLAFHYDLEFVDSGNQGLELISIGGVFERAGIKMDFYAINEEFFSTETWKQFLSGKHPNQEFMTNNVFAQINAQARRADGSYSSPMTLKQVIERNIDSQLQIPTYQPYSSNTVVGSLSTIAEALAATAADLGATEAQKVYPIGYYVAHDHVGLCNIFGGMLSMPNTWSYYSYDLRTLIDFYGEDPAAFEPVTPHHALADARAQRETYLRLV